MRALRQLLEPFRHLTPNTRVFLAGSTLTGVGFAGFWVLLNLYLRSVGFSETSIGQVLSVHTLGNLLVALPGAYLVERVRTGRVVAVAAFLCAGGYGLQLLPVPRHWVLVGALVAGMGLALHWAAANPFYMWNSEKEWRPFLFAFGSALDFGAGALGSLVGGRVAAGIGHALASETMGLRLTLAGFTAFFLVGAVVFLRIGPSPGRPRDPVPLRDYVRARDWGLLGKLIVPDAFVGIGAGLSIPFLNLYFRDRFGSGSGTIGSLFAGNQGLIVAASLLMPVLVRRVGMIRAVVAVQIVSLPFLLSLAFTHSFPVAAVAFLARGMLMNLGHPIASNFAMEVAGPRSHAVTNATKNLSWNLAWAVSTNVGGRLIDRAGYTPPMLLTCLMYVTSAALYFRFFFHGGSPEWRELGRAGHEAETV